MPSSQHILFKVLLLAGVSLLLTACDLTQRFASPENRINAELPLQVDTRQAHERLVEQVASQPPERSALEKAWEAKLRLRALSCSPEYTPSWTQSSAAVRAALKDKACFAEFDHKLQRWVGMQRVRLLLAQAMPEPSKEAPSSLTLQGSGYSLSGKDGSAPVIALLSQEGFELVSLLDGRVLFKERDRPQELNVSPNGRLFAQTGIGGVRIRASEGGETLLELHEARGITWLGKDLIALQGSQQGKQAVLALQRGEELPLPVDTLGHRSTLLPVPGMENRFTVLTYQGAFQFEYQNEGAAAAKLTLVAEKLGSNNGLFVFNSLPSATNGQEWMLSPRKLLRFNPKTLEIKEVSFEPVQVTRAVPSSEPEQFLLQLAMPGASANSRNGLYLFDAAQGTLARLEDTDQQQAEQIRYLPALKRFAQLHPPLIRLVDKWQTAAPEPTEQVISAMIAEANQAMLAQATMVAERQKLEAGSAVAADPSLTALFRDARVEGLGVYEGKEKSLASLNSGPPRKVGKVQVDVRRSSRPLVLVLSAYDPVQWTLRLEPGARVAAVLLSGYNESSVIGMGNARVLKIGSDSAYTQENENYPALQRQVLRWAGKPMAVFQGAYAGSSFSVGGP